DLLVSEASNGRMRAQVATAIEGMTQPTGWHYHVCEGQLVYTTRGWADLQFNDQRIRLEAGDSIFIPGGVPHNEIATSTDFEYIEVSVPAEMGTVACDPPAGLA
ncbi:MAG: cupin domain-containing protein, partial [Desulfobacterales bacterium]|nr:cupin domain-containing protein [Desulfobacterales bacterium]